MPYSRILRLQHRPRFTKRQEKSHPQPPTWPRAMASLPAASGIYKEREKRKGEMQDPIHGPSERKVVYCLENIYRQAGRQAGSPETAKDFGRGAFCSGQTYGRSLSAGSLPRVVRIRIHRLLDCIVYIKKTKSASDVNAPDVRPLVLVHA